MATLQLNAKITAASVTQTANKELGFPEKQLHYLLIETDKGKETLNVGKKTVEKINKLTTK